MEDRPSNKMTFSYQKKGLYFSCLIGLFLTALSVYVLARENTQQATAILASITATMMFLLTIRCLAQTQEKIIVTDATIKWVRCWQTIEFPLTKISELEPFISIDGTGLEVRAKTGQKIRFMTNINGFWALNQELKKYLLVVQQIV